MILEEEKILGSMNKLTVSFIASISLMVLIWFFYIHLDSSNSLGIGIVSPLLIGIFVITSLFLVLKQRSREVEGFYIICGCYFLLLMLFYIDQLSFKNELENLRHSKEFFELNNPFEIYGNFHLFFLVYALLSLLVFCCIFFKWKN